MGMVLTGQLPLLLLFSSATPAAFCRQTRCIAHLLFVFFLVVRRLSINASLLLTFPSSTPHSRLQNFRYYDTRPTHLRASSWSPLLIHIHQASIASTIVMGSLRFDEFADSPAMILPQHQLSFGPLSSNYYAPQQQPRPFVPMLSTNTPRNTLSQSNNAFTSPSTVSPPVNSIKRKRDHSDDELPSTIAATPQSAAVELIYGEGMMLISPTNGLSMTAESQSGTWFDEKLDANARANARVEDLRVQGEEDAQALRRVKQPRRPSSSVKQASSPKAAIEEPIVDEYTLLLGVGWTRIGSDDDKQMAIRGWTRYIENHYPLQDVDILASSKAMDGLLLVCARNGAKKGYFLFSENLVQARLVAYNWEICIGRLHTFTFENDETLQAAKTPTLGAMRTGGACAMLPGLATLPADDIMLCD